MPLILVTGPANAAKAGFVLERLRAALPREPLLVVPTSADASHYRRELAAAGIVFGADVLTFPELARLLARATGAPTRVLGDVARGRVVRAAIGDVPLRALAASSAAPGFAAALDALFGELQRWLVRPRRFAAAVRAWEAAGEAPAHARELAALYGAYHARLQALDALDADGQALAALDALRASPAAWGARPVFVYGFDDLSPAQLDAVETLADRAQAEVCVALPYEPGRAAFAGVAAAVELLKPLAAEHVRLPARSEHYAPSARAALHHLERSLFEPGAERRPPNGAVRLLEAGGERAEAELAGAEVLELLRDGMAPEEIAVLVRGAGTADLFAQVLEGYGVPVARDRRTPLERTRLGAGVLAAARAALPGGTAADLLTWLRTPGKLLEPDAADRLELEVRRGQVATAREARRLWERAAGARPLAELDALAAAAERPPDPRERAAAFLAALVAEADAIWTAPHRRRGEVLPPEVEADARAAAALRRAAGELSALARSDPALAGEPAELLAALAAVPVREASGAREGAPGVLLAEPHEIRARRFRAVLLCGLQDGELPRRPSPEPFLDDHARASLARASGLVLARSEDLPARERLLAYACASRPEQALLLSFRSSDEEGEPLQRSPFVDDVRALFTDELWSGRGRRLLADVTWPPAAAPTPHELRRARAAALACPAPPPLGAPGSAAALSAIAERERESARGVETFAACGVRWLVEHLVRPQAIDPDPEPMRRGALAHRALERTLRLLAERAGSARLTPETLEAALAALDDALAEPGVVGRGTARRRATVRALRADLERYLREEAENGAGWEPARLEWAFGAEDAEAEPLVLAGVAIGGRVDRVDVAADGNRAIVRDYKGRTVSGPARWAEDGRLQVALYALAARERLGLDVAAAVYQPIGSGDQRPRGLVRADVPGAYVNGDRVEPEEFAAALDEARAAAEQAVRELRAGRIAPCPARCSPRGCAHPGICRGEGAA